MLDALVRALQPIAIVVMPNGWEKDSDKRVVNSVKRAFGVNVRVKRCQLQKFVTLKTTIVTV